MSTQLVDSDGEEVFNKDSQKYFKEEDIDDIEDVAGCRRHSASFTEGIRGGEGSGGAEVVGALRTTLLLGAPIVNEFQDPDTKMLTMNE